LRRTYFQLFYRVQRTYVTFETLYLISVWCHHYNYSPCGADNPSYVTCYTPFGCTSKPVRLVCFHLSRGGNFKVHTHWTLDVSVSDLHRGCQVSRGD
jgi:hypothetical protein